MKNHFEHIPELIQEHLLGGLNVDEEKEIQDWCKSSEVHDRIFKKVISHKNFQENSKKYSEYDKEKAWENINRQINKKERTRMISHVIKYAAVIVFPLLTAGLLYYISQEEVVSFSEEGLINNQTAVELTLSNGEVVRLSGEKRVIEDEGISGIIDDSLKGIRYDKLRSSATEKVQMNTLKTPRGKNYRLLLADGTEVWLNAESSITYPVQFISEKRAVTITGEAYLKVSHEKNRPFVVQTRQSEIVVLGTKFNVNAYAESSMEYTTLVEGKVKIKDKHNKIRLLTPNQQSVVGRNVDLYVKDIDVNQEIDWRLGLFNFKDTPLNKILNELKRWYDFEVIYESEKLKQYTFTGKIKRDRKLEDLLGLFEMTGTVNFKLKNKILHVCEL